jgi:hypothetical protein
MEDFLVALLRPRLLKGTDARIYGVLDALDLILQPSRYIVCLAGYLTSFGRSAFDAVIHAVSQMCQRFLSGFRREQDGNCRSDQSSHAKCGYRLHVMHLLFIGYPPRTSKLGTIPIFGFSANNIRVTLEQPRLPHSSTPLRHLQLAQASYRQEDGCNLNKIPFAEH